MTPHKITVSKYKTSKAAEWEKPPKHSYVCKQLENVIYWYFLPNIFVSWREENLILIWAFILSKVAIRR